MKTKEKSEGRFCVDIIESESGWGRRIDETLRFKTLEEAEKFSLDYNIKYNSKATAPSWYMMAGKPYIKSK